LHLQIPWFRFLLCRCCVLISFLSERDDVFLLFHFSLLTIFNLNDSLILISVIVLFCLTDHKSFRVFSVKDFLIPPNTLNLFCFKFQSFNLSCQETYLFTTRSAFYEKLWFHLNKTPRNFAGFLLMYLSKAMVCYLFLN